MAIRIWHRLTNPAIRGARRPDAKVAIAVAGRDFRRWLRAHPLSQADRARQEGRANRPGAQKNAVHTAPLAVPAQKAGAMAQAHTVRAATVEALVRHST